MYVCNDKQHFGNNIYGITSEDQAQTFMEEAIKIFFRTIIKISKDKHKKRISYAMPKLEVDCIIRSIDIDTIMPIACGMP